MSLLQNIIFTFICTPITHPQGLLYYYTLTIINKCCNHLHVKPEFFSFSSSLWLWRSQMYNRYNIKWALFIFLVIFEYLHNHEKVCSQISVSTWWIERAVCKLHCTNMSGIRWHIWVLTLFSSAMFRGSQFAKHHLSTWPAMCILSTTISRDAIYLLVGVRSLRIGFLANLCRWHPSS